MKPSSNQQIKKKTTLLISTQHNSLQLFKVHDYRGWNISRNIYLYPYFFPINFVNLVNHQHLNLLTWRVSELSLCLIAGDSPGKSLGSTENPNTCLRQRKKRNNKNKKKEKTPTECSSRENKNTVFSLSLFQVTAWCWHVLHQPVRRCFAKALHLLLHMDKILSEGMLLPAKPKYLGRSSPGSQASLKMCSMVMQAKNGLKL